MQTIKNQFLATFDKILIPIAINFISNSPELQSVLILAYWFFWIGIQYKQNEINEFVQILIDNPWIFTKKIIKTKEFKDWFLFILENYLK